MMLHFSLVFHASFSKVSRNLIVDFRMSADAVIKHLNILKRHALCFRSFFEFLVMQTFGFHCAKQALHWGVVRALHCVQRPAKSELATITFHTLLATLVA